MSEKLKNLKTKIEDIVEDLATLEVASFTGEEIKLDAAVEGEEYKSKKVFGMIRKGLTTATLVGYSKFEVEGDSINYINSDLGEGKKYLIDGHNALVEGAQKTRKDLFEFVLKAIKGN